MTKHDADELPRKGSSAAVQDIIQWQLLTIDLLCGSEDDVSKGEVLTMPTFTKPKPESIANLSDEELAVMEKKMVRKVDMVVMPIIGILYILNCKSLFYSPPSIRTG
ncbi:unnamed protein product [Clonostachys rosea]|uniref:Uncharacterized protein n=1 Tax=Bionectria ochroleuca TaxID=29856 RepID=A0ABY6UW34_BIOOC|nr:unnamed protein product [Clonostachys rosea]